MFFEIKQNKNHHFTKNKLSSVLLRPSKYLKWDPSMPVWLAQSAGNQGDNLALFIMFYVAS